MNTPNIKFINEEGRTEDYLEWAKKINQEVDKVDMSIAFSSTDDGIERTQAIDKLANIFPDKKILVYTQELGRGGVGDFQELSLIHTAIVGLIIVVNTTFASTFFAEFAKDVYKSTLGKLFSKSPHNKQSIGDIIFQTETKFGEVQYVILRYFSIEDRIMAFIRIQDHLSKLKAKDIQGGFARFVFDRKEGKWLPM